MQAARATTRTRPVHRAANTHSPRREPVQLKWTMRVSSRYPAAPQSPHSHTEVGWRSRGEGASAPPSSHVSGVRFAPIASPSLERVLPLPVAGGSTATRASILPLPSLPSKPQPHPLEQGGISSHGRVKRSPAGRRRTPAMGRRRSPVRTGGAVRWWPWLPLPFFTAHARFTSLNPSE